MQMGSFGGGIRPFLGDTVPRSGAMGNRGQAWPRFWGVVRRVGFVWRGCVGGFRAETPFSVSWSGFSVAEVGFISSTRFDLNLCGCQRTGGANASVYITLRVPE